METPGSWVPHIHQEFPLKGEPLTETLPKQNKLNRTEEKEPSRTGPGAGLVEGGFDAAAGTGAACEGPSNVQSTLGVYKKEGGERRATLAHSSDGESYRRGISATRDLDAIPLTILSWLERGTGLDEGAVFPFCWYLALYASMAG